MVLLFSNHPIRDYPRLSTVSFALPITRSPDHGDHPIFSVPPW